MSSSAKRVHADVRLSVSKWQQEYLRSHHGIDADYLPNGVDVSSCDAADGERFKHKYRVSDYVLYVGRNDPVKNPAEFVRLAQQMPDRKFVMIGGGLTTTALATDWDVEAPSNLSVLGRTDTHRNVGCGGRFLCGCDYQFA